MRKQKQIEIEKQLLARTGKAELSYAEIYEAGYQDGCDDTRMEMLSSDCDPDCIECFGNPATLW